MKRLALLALVPAVLVLGCASPAPDPGAALAAEAQRALGQFDAAWSPKRKPLGEARGAQLELRDRLFRLAPEAAARPEEFCSDEMRSPGELALFARINAMYDELMSGVLDELAVHQTWSRRFGEARSAGRPDALKRPLYRELVWSRARLDMRRTLLAAYRMDAEVQALRMQNTCLARIILGANSAHRGDAGLIDLEDRLERETARVLPSFESAYRDALSRIGSMPGRP